MADSCVFDFTQLVKVMRDLGDAGNAAIAKQQPVMAEAVVAAVHVEFETEGRGRWPDLADSTKLRRR